LSAEVKDWVASLPPSDLQIVRHMIGLLQTQGHQMRMPHSRALGDRLFELRFDLQQGAVAQRVTYFFDKDVITLTTFRKTRQVEAAQISRARRAMDEYWRQK